MPVFSRGTRKWKEKKFHCHCSLSFLSFNSPTRWQIRWWHCSLQFTTGITRDATTKFKTK